MTLYSQSILVQAFLYLLIILRNFIPFSSEISLVIYRSVYFSAIILINIFYINSNRMNSLYLFTWIFFWCHFGWGLLPCYSTILFLRQVTSLSCSIVNILNQFLWIPSNPEAFLLDCFLCTHIEVSFMHTFYRTDIFTFYFSDDFSVTLTIQMVHCNLFGVPIFHSWNYICL